MNIPEEAKVTALSAAFTALAQTLYDDGKLRPEALLAHIAGFVQHLAENDQEIAAHALKDLVEPIAAAMGYRGDLG